MSMLLLLASLHFDSDRERGKIVLVCREPGAAEGQQQGTESHVCGCLGGVCLVSAWGD